MNYTPALMSNFKTPLSTNDLKPTYIQNSGTNIPMTNSNNRKLDPAVLNRIREDSNVSDGTIAPPKNPFRAKTGLLFRDILGRADNTRSCSSCGKKT